MREYIDGATAIVRGALDAGCTFFAGYPITPASGILMQMMRELPRTGGVAVQGEDEIASIGMCIGATLGGARAMTATSGPGISLYSENLGLAVMGEVPLVVVDVQRLGPSTGAATTVSQGDVQFVRWGTAGGYPIIALAPSNLVEAYRLTVKAFDLAERFRCPVFVLTDKELVMSTTTVDTSAFGGVAARARSALGSGEPYAYEPPDAVFPLHEFGRGGVVRFTGSTHDERAIITKDTATIERLNRHLIAKIDDHREEIEMVDEDLEGGASTLVLGYGIVGGVVRAAVADARARGMSVSGVVVQSLWPVPETALARAMAGADRVVVAELNHGLYRREIERIAGGREVVGVERIDGDLIAPEQIVEVIR
ncbi:MAG TPA: pyruvate flavodoxin/ferredoxin oxidoreductase [Acidimicrobiia bacterium]|nr:pyruvate flavodoxin/ferredoxin oxidoreductase [Acidimicrobiia bacterium]